MLVMLPALPRAVGSSPQCLLLSIVAKIDLCKISGLGSALRRGVAGAVAGCLAGGVHACVLTMHSSNPEVFQALARWGQRWEAAGPGHGAEKAARLCRRSASPPAWGPCSGGSNGVSSSGSANEQLSAGQAQRCFAVAFASLASCSPGCGCLRVTPCPSPRQGRSSGLTLPHQPSAPEFKCVLCH